MQAFLFLALIFAFALVIMAIQNAAVIKVTFIAWTFEGPLAFVLALAFAVGLISGIFIALPALWRKSRQIRTQKKLIKELEESKQSISGERSDAAEGEKEAAENKTGMPS